MRRDRLARHRAHTPPAPPPAPLVPLPPSPAASGEVSAPVAAPAPPRSLWAEYSLVWQARYIALQGPPVVRRPSLVEPPDGIPWVPPAMANPRVSVIVRCFNEPRAWLDKCVQSVLDTCADAEVILVDDQGPTEPWDWPLRSERVGYVRLPVDVGCGPAMNPGILRARGDYLRKLDADDWVEAGDLDAQIEILDTDSAAMIVFGAQQNQNPDGSRTPGDQNAWEACGRDRIAFKRLLIQDPCTRVPGPAPMWRKAWVGNVLCHHDFEHVDDGAWYRLALSADPSPVCAAWTDRVVLRYRGREDSHGHGPEYNRRLVLARAVMAQALTQPQPVVRHRIKVAYVGDAECGGAQWLHAQVAARLDRTQFEPVWYVGQKTVLSGWLEHHGVRVEAVNWGTLPTVARGFDIVQTVWDAAVVSAPLKAVVGKIVVAMVNQRLADGHNLPSDPCMALADCLVACGEDVVQAGAVLNRPIELIRSPVDSWAMREHEARRGPLRRALGFGEQERVALWCGRWHATKRPQVLLDLVQATRGKLRWLVLASLHDIPEPERVKVRAVLAEAGVVLREGLWPWQTPEHIACADFYVSTSEAEGLSLAFLEACAAGVVPVVTDTGGMRLLCWPGVTGWIVPADQPQQLQPALLAALALPAAARAQMRRWLRTGATALCDVREVVRQWERLYRRLVSGC